ncbi:transcriptional regulator with XRE-family HTH domain [Kerstersia gyiorum]|nr:helix-turn-helix transcriptional regulator [Kerstersia gyiorum]MCP1711203.1 transcriptional regulator with XRE-family HTH domain [Kerstersia gyiorum]
MVATEEVVNVLADKLRQLRKQAGLILQQLSERSGISASALSKIENGQLSPTYEKIAALARGLDINVGALFQPDDRKPTAL